MLFINTPPPIAIKPMHITNSYIYILPYPSYPLYPYILPLIPLFDTHSFTKSLFSHPTHCLSPFFSSPFVTHESTSFASLHVIILIRMRPSYSASFIHFWLHIHLIPFPTLFYPHSYFTLHIFPFFHQRTRHFYCPSSSKPSSQLSYVPNSLSIKPHAWDLVLPVLGC